MPTSTTNYGLQKPLVNSATDQDLWGGELNDDLDELDGLMKTALEWATSAKTSSFSITGATAGTSTTGDTNVLFLCDATGGAINATLPSPVAGFVCAIKKTDSSSNAVTVVGTIDGASNYSISTQNNSIVVVGTATGYQVVSDVKVVPVPDATTSVKGIVQLATQADLETPSSSTLAVVPSVVKNHPGVAKAWVTFNGSGTILANHNFSSVTRNATGQFTAVMATAMSSTNFGVLVSVSGIGTPWNVTSGAAYNINSTTSITVFPTYFGSGVNNAYNPDTTTIVVFGDY